MFMELIIGALVALVILLTVWIVVLKHKNSFQKMIIEMQNSVLVEARNKLQEAADAARNIKEQSEHLEEIEIAIKPKKQRGRPRKN